jgi:hypothetical protein
VGTDPSPTIQNVDCVAEAKNQKKSDAAKCKIKYAAFGVLLLLAIK